MEPVLGDYYPSQSPEEMPLKGYDGSNMATKDGTRSRAHTHLVGKTSRSSDTSFEAEQCTEQLLGSATESRTMRECKAWWLCFGLFLCRLFMFALGFVGTAAVLWWQCAPVLEGVVQQDQLDLQRQLQSVQHSLLEQMQQRLQGLQLRRQLMALQKQPGHHPTALDARLGSLYCKTVRGQDLQQSEFFHRIDQGPTAPPSPSQPPANPQALVVDLMDRVEQLEQLNSEDGSIKDMPGSEGEYYLPSPAPGPAPSVSFPQVATTRRLARRRYAYVMMAHDPPNDNVEHLLNVLPIARALQRMSEYPLLVLTNQTEFRDGTPVKESLSKLNIIVRPLHEIQMPPRLARVAMTPTWRVAYWKLQIWLLTEYEKLIWLDADSVVYRGLDWLFARDWMYAQRDDWFCKFKQPGVCSGLMLIFPSEEDYDGLMRYVKTLPELPGGDQQLIAMYFNKTRRPINLLSDLEASFGQCAGKAPTPYFNPDGTSVGGVWSIPNFVHKSGGWGDTNNNVYNNVCFTSNLSRQLYIIGRTVVNVCQFHPLGPYWRDLFCDATAWIGLRMPEVKIFCDDRCWYLGLKGDLPGEAVCGPLNATISLKAYYAGEKGKPVPETSTVTVI